MLRDIYLAERAKYLTVCRTRFIYTEIGVKQGAAFMDSGNKRRLPEHTESHEENHDDECRLQKVADTAQDILIKAESTFPFMLFPDTITVSRMKVTITRRSFFRVADVISLQIEDILNVEIDTGPFFGSLNIYTRIYGTDPLRITYLRRKSAIEVKRILEGYVIARQRDIDTSDIEKGELIALLTQLGSDSAMT